MMSAPILLSRVVMYVDESSHADAYISYAHCSNQLQLRSGEEESHTASTRLVRFESATPKVLNPESECLSHEDCLTRWWSNDELEKIQKDAKLLCSQFQHHANQDCDCDLTMAHHKITLLLASKFRTLLKLSPTSPDQDLTKWCSCNDGRRGLERIVSKTYSSFRQTDVRHTRMMVLTEQKRQRDEDMNDPETIAVISQSASRRARTFALHMASADASVIANEKIR